MVLFKRMMGAMFLDPMTFEDVEADHSANLQALLVVLLSALAVGLGSASDLPSIFLLVAAFVLAWLVWALFGLTLLFVYGYTFTIFANLIASPFYGVLAERTQHVLGHETVAETLDLATIKAIAWRSFVRELRKSSPPFVRRSAATPPQVGSTGLAREQNPRF